MPTANCCYLKSFYLEANLQVFFKPSTFPHDQKWSQYKSLSFALMLGHPPFSLSSIVAWVAVFSGASDCVFLAHKPGFATLVLCWLTSSKCWILNHHLYYLDSVAFWALCTLSDSSLCLTSLIFCYFFSFVCSLSPVSLAYSTCLFNFVHWLVCSFIPPLINSKRIWGTGFHLLPLPFLLSLTNFLSRNPLIWQKRIGFLARLPRKLSPSGNILPICNIFWSLRMETRSFHLSRKALATAVWHDQPFLRMSMDDLLFISSYYKDTISAFKPLLLDICGQTVTTLQFGRGNKANNNNNNNKWCRHYSKQ